MKFLLFTDSKIFYFSELFSAAVVSTVLTALKSREQQIDINRHNALISDQVLCTFLWYLLMWVWIEFFVLNDRSQYGQGMGSQCMCLDSMCLWRLCRYWTSWLQMLHRQYPDSSCSIWRSLHTEIGKMILTFFLSPLWLDFCWLLF